MGPSIDNELDENPTLIQTLSKKSRQVSSPALPLILFHDGSGTIFNYFLLEPLGRDVFGFADPKAAAEGEWEGGIAEMAQYYYDCMEQVIAPGAVILGGWSSGGVLALEVASMIQENKSSPFTLAGVIMVDTVCPVGAEDVDTDLSEYQSTRGVHATAKSQALAEASMRRTRLMLSRWWCSVHPHKSTRLPCMLIRASEGIDKEDPRGLLLGWEVFAGCLDVHVLETPGHHHSIFSEANSRVLSDRVREACERTEHRHIHDQHEKNSR